MFGFHRHSQVGWYIVWQRVINFPCLVFGLNDTLFNPDLISNFQLGKWSLLSFLTFLIFTKLEVSLNIKLAICGCTIRWCTNNFLIHIFINLFDWCWLDVFCQFVYDYFNWEVVDCLGNSINLKDQFKIACIDILISIFIVQLTILSNQIAKIIKKLFSTLE